MASVIMSSIPVLCLLYSLQIGFCGFLFSSGANIYITDLQDCDVEKKGYYMNLKLKDGDSGIAASGDWEFKEDVSDDFKFNLYVDKKVGAEWAKNVFKLEMESLCSYTMEYGGNAWARAAAMAVPNMNPECPIDAGKYNIEDFQGEPDDFNAPRMMHGDYSAHFEIFDPSGDLAFCLIVNATFP